MSSYTTNDDDVIKDELNHINKNYEDYKTGLAISGGGIRSASFAMGVMQAMVNAGVLKKMDYLSTVSGGGYLGSSLTYFLSQTMPDGKPYGTEKQTFPFGQVREGNKVNDKNKILDFIRQHGNYLVPGNHLNTLSFIAVVIRTVLISFAIYFALATSVFLVLLKFLSPNQITAISVYVVVLAIVLWILVSMVYSVITVFKIPKYLISVYVQAIQGKLIAVIIGFAVPAAIPWLHANVEYMAINYLTMTGDLADNKVGGSMSGISLAIGVLLSLLAHLRQMGSSNKSISTWQIVLAAILLLFAVFYGAYVAAEHISELGNARWIFFTMLGASVFFGLVCNVNYFGLNRMYRDRLMETFMPDADSIESGKWNRAGKANTTKMADMCRSPNQRPYHLVNCNIVLVDSANPKYRGRSGDSFTISPLYCGSDATGWRKTSNFMVNLFRGGIMLPTAMAISGAAANPNSGVAGRGVTVDKFVSTVMSLLNLRLGFWAENPRCEKTWMAPNYFSPGLKGGLFSRGLNEKDRTIELSDGGHFENLAVYELLRRRLDLIIVSDAGADGNFEFSDLANLLERARVDFGLNIKFLDQYTFTDIIPNKDIQQPGKDNNRFNLSDRAFAIARIEYRKEKAKDPRHIGHLIYIKPTMIKNLSPDVVGYKKLEPTFPHQTTLDQFFSEQQFEAYRELGYYLGWTMLDDPEVKKLLNGNAQVWETPPSP